MTGVTHPSTGVYCIAVASGIDPTAAVATPRADDSTSAGVRLQWSELEPSRRKVRNPLENATFLSVKVDLPATTARNV